MNLLSLQKLNGIFQKLRNKAKRNNWEVKINSRNGVPRADIIALAARESVSSTGGPFIHIPLGRKDSTTCSYPRADALLPSPTITVEELLNIFVAKGMNLEESVTILGAHTLGVGHCINIVDRLYNPKPNDWIDYSFEAQLKLNCPQTLSPFTNFTLLPNDTTPFTFDNQYYRDIVLGRGLFGIASSLSRDPRTAFIYSETIRGEPKLLFRRVFFGICEAFTD